MTKDCCQTPSVAHETCYRAQCFATVRDFVRALVFRPAGYSVSFQSRLGREPWMQPYTDQVLVRLATAASGGLWCFAPPSSPIAWRRSRKSDCGGVSRF